MAKKKKTIILFLGALLQLLPLEYWILTEGKKPLYAENHFFPNYFVMLLISIVIAIVNCTVNRKILKDTFCYLNEMVIVILLVGIIFGGYIIFIREESGMGWVFFFVMYLVGLYEIVQLVIHIIIDKVIEKRY